MSNIIITSGKYELKLNGIEFLHLYLFTKLYFWHLLYSSSIFRVSSAIQPPHYMQSNICNFAFFTTDHHH